MKKPVLVSSALSLALVVVSGNLVYKERELTKVKGELDKVTQQNKLYKKELKELNTLSKQYQEEIKALKVNLNNLSDRNKTLENTNVNLQKENSALQLENKKLRTDLQNVRREIRSLKRQLGAKKSTSSLSSRGKVDSPRSAKSIRVTGTAYTAYCKDCSGITKLGLNLRKNPKAKVIAVDPNVIPLGSVVRLTSPSYPKINGIYIAGDAGGAIKGHKIDIFMPDINEAYKFGVRSDITVEIIRGR